MNTQQSGFNAWLSDNQKYHREFYLKSKVQAPARKAKTVDKMTLKTRNKIEDLLLARKLGVSVDEL